MTYIKNHIEKTIYGFITTNARLVTPAYRHWLADVHSGSFAPAFTLSLCDSECSRNPPNAHSLGRYKQP
jgi:hypothetical protein